MDVKDEYNPIQHPELYRTTALKWVWLWLQLEPWIRADIVHFVRTPGHFDVQLERAAARITTGRCERHPELTRLVRDGVHEDSALWKSLERQLVLGLSDDQFRATLRSRFPELSKAEVEQELQHMRRARAQDPFVLDPQEAGLGSEILQVSSGSSYEMAKWTAAISGSHLITDIESRWAEIRIDREEANVVNDAWTPFAKAFSGVPFKYLDNVPLDAALALRKEERLADLRGCLQKAWRACREDDQLARANVAHITAELKDLMREADADWRDIQASMVKIVGAEMAGLGSVIATGTAEWLPPGIAATGMAAANVIGQRLKRRAYVRRHPASFLLSLSSKRTS